MTSSERLFASLTTRVRGTKRVLVFPEATDQRVQAAARQIQSEGLAEVVLVTNDEVVESENVGVVAPASDSRLDEFAALYCSSRPRTKVAVARKIVAKPLFFAGMMVRSGAADAMIAGATTTTAKVIEASLLTVGLAPGIQTPSSSFLMVLPAQAPGASPARVLLFADCAVNVSPTESELADIALASAHTYQSLTGQVPRVAMLSFATHGSASHELVSKVANATRLAHEKNPNLLIDGELQADAALVERVALAKVQRESTVAGAANVLVFPSLEAGNIAYKLTQYLGQAQALGPILQGFSRPLCDLSRGATIDDIVASAILTLAQDFND